MNPPKKTLLTLFIATIAPALLAKETMYLRDIDGRTIEAVVLKVTKESVTFEMASDGREFTLPLSRFSEITLEELSDWEPPGEEGEVEISREEIGAGIPSELPKALYPRQIDEIREALEEIDGREIPSGIEADQHEAIQLLNKYRYLCGVDYDVEPDKEMIAGAFDAAEACQEHGNTSHDLGRSTDKCNLHQGMETLARTVTGYIEDPGEKNRTHRGHRLWCLNAPMKKTGFGKSSENSFFGMWAMDESGKQSRRSWGYPGEGLFPLQFLHGDAWTRYLTEKAPEADKLKVEVFLLPERPEKKILPGDDAPGIAIEIDYVSVERHAINFEPGVITEPGIYFVRIRGGGVREEYLVELF